MKSPTRVLIYFIICLIASWYAIVLYWIYSPNPSIEYRLYYIDKVLSDWPGQGGLKYEFGTMLSFGKESISETLVKNKGQGWSKPEADHTWTIDDTAVLFFIIEKDIVSGERESDIIIKAEVQAFIVREFGLTEQIVVVKVNDQEIDNWIIDQEDYFEYVTIIPKTLINDQLLKISFEIVNATSPKELGLSEDSSNLGLAFRYILLEKSTIP